MDKKLRYFFSFFVGILVFFFLYVFVTWALTFLKITPYGKFVATFFKGRTPDEAKAFIEANKDLFNQMLPAATHFSNIVISPTVGLVTGIVVGLIVSSRRALEGVVLSLATVTPVAVMFWMKLASDPYRVLYVGLFYVITGVGGFIGTRIITSNR